MLGDRLTKFYEAEGKITKPQPTVPPKRRHSYEEDQEFRSIRGLLASMPVFLGSWAYCAYTYGFLFGFGLGWLPSLILAGIVYFVVFAFPGAIWLGLLALIYVFRDYLK